MTSIELVSAQCAHYRIGALEDTLLPLLVGDKVAHFTVGGLAPLHSIHTDYNPNVLRKFYRWGLEYSIVEKLDLSNYILPPAQKMATAVVDSINYHRDTPRCRSCPNTLHTSLTPAGLYVSNYQKEAELTTNGPDGVGAISMSEADTTFKDTRKIVLILTSPLSLLYAATLNNNTIHLTSYLINPWLLCIYRAVKPSLEAREILPPKPIPHTCAKLHHIAYPTTPVNDATWATSGLPPHKITRPTHHNHIADRHKITFDSVTLHAHGSSLLGGSAKIYTHVDCSSYLARAIDKLVRLKSLTHPCQEMNMLTTRPNPTIMLGSVTRPTSPMLTLFL
jgi:hypothetical protein